MRQSHAADGHKCFRLFQSHLLFFKDAHPYLLTISTPFRGNLNRAGSEIKEKGKAIGKSQLTPLSIMGSFPTVQGSSLLERFMSPSTPNPGEGKWQLPPPLKTHIFAVGKTALRKQTYQEVDQSNLQDLLSCDNYSPFSSTHQAKHFKFPKSSQQLCKIRIIILVL